MQQTGTPLPPKTRTNKQTNKIKQNKTTTITAIKIKIQNEIKAEKKGIQ